MNKKLYYSASVIGAFVLSACQGTTSQPSNVFRFATWAAGNELVELRQVVDRVNTGANGEYLIDIVSIPSSYYVKLAVFIGGSQAPDFFWLTQELIPKYAHDLKVLVDLTDPLTASETLNIDDYYEGVLKSAQYNGSVWGLPWIANPLMIYYNKTLFNQAGITPPTFDSDWTWQEFIETAEALTGLENHRNEKVFGTVIDGWPNIETFLWSGGGDVIGSDYETIELDSEPSLAGLNNLATILKKGLTPTKSEVDGLGGNNVWFERQRTAMFMGGVQDNFEFKVGLLPTSDQFEIGYAPMPVNLDQSRSAFNWTASTVMHKSRADNPLAYKALEALTMSIFDWKIAPPIKNSEDKIAQNVPLKINAVDAINFTLNFARSGNYIPEWDGTSGINHRLWYDLYYKMILDPNFDYTTAAQEIATFSRELISKRT
jgi:multiple sugar transport system substrate-binding protein